MGMNYNTIVDIYNSGSMSNIYLARAIIREWDEQDVYNLLKTFAASKWTLSEIVGGVVGDDKVSSTMIWIGCPITNYDYYMIFKWEIDVNVIKDIFGGTQDFNSYHSIK